MLRACWAVTHIMLTSVRMGRHCIPTSAPCEEGLFHPLSRVSTAADVSKVLHCVLQGISFVFCIKGEGAVFEHEHCKASTSKGILPTERGGILTMLVRE